MEKNNNDPVHVAVILDGNGRWAERNGLLHAEGHFRGAEAVVKLIENIGKYDTKYVTLYAFSTENWKRSKEEVDALMDLLCEFIDSNIDKMIENETRLLSSGRIEGLPLKCREKLEYAREKTSKNYKRTLILALNYGGRCEIVDSIKRIAEKVKNNALNISDIDEKIVTENLYHPDIPDPDLLIRTSGEIRLSNFLLWELSYSEFYFTDVLWPDFDSIELEKAMETYKNRKRRFGGRA